MTVWPTAASEVAARIAPAAESRHERQVARLLAVAEDDDRLARLHAPHDDRHQPRVGGVVLARAIGVEGSHDDVLEPEGQRVESATRSVAALAAAYGVCGLSGWSSAIGVRSAVP